MNLIKQEYKTHIQEANGLSFIPWAVALQMAGRPRQTVLTFDNAQPVRYFFGGAVVGVRQDGQEIYLPILDAKHNPVPRPSARDVSDSINRCRAKAVAMVDGFGLGLYAGFNSAAEFIRALGEIKAGDDLTRIKPMTEKKPGGGAEYVPWPAAIAAARLAYPDFTWRVLEFHTADKDGEAGDYPFVRVGDHYMVAVEVSAEAIGTHTEYLPIMGVVEVQTKRGPKKLDHQPLVNPSVADWNKTVMRCLTKAIAVATGYGIEVYGEEIAVPAEEEAEEGAPKAANDAGAEMAARKADLVIAIRDRLRETGRHEAKLIAWLGRKAKSIEELDQEALLTAARALKVA